MGTALNLINLNFIKFVQNFMHQVQKEHHYFIKRVCLNYLINLLNLLVFPFLIDIISDDIHEICLLLV